MTKIRVRLGQSEAEVDADQEHLREAIDLVPVLAAKLPGATQTEAKGLKSRLSGQLGETPEGVERDLSDLPVIAVDKGDSLADVIGKFFADPWGRQRRKLSDVREALQSYGLNYPKQSVAVALLRLAKNARIRRFKAEDGEFVYTASAMLVPIPPDRKEKTFDELAATQPGQ